MRILIALLVAELLVPLFFHGDAAWYSHDILTHIRLAAIAGLLAKYVPYRRLALKCAVTWYALSELLQVGAELYWYLAGAYSPYVDAGRVILAGAVMVFYLCRRYNYPSDTLDNGHVFLVFRKPRTPQDWLLAMFGRPFGGVGVYCQGRWYQFRGVLQQSDASRLSTRLPAHVIIRVRPVKNEQFSEYVGTKWTVMTNCVTLLAPMAIVGTPAPWIKKPR